GHRGAVGRAARPHRLQRGLRDPGGAARAPPGRRDPRRPAARGAPARLHARAAQGPRRPAHGRGLVPRPGHRRGGHEPRRQGHLPRAGPARGLPHHAHDGRRRVRADHGARARGRARRRGHRGPPAHGRGPGLHRGVGAGAQDRLDRPEREARRDRPRLRGERHERPAALRVGRGVRAAGRADDLRAARVRRHGRSHALLPQARGAPLRPGARAAPAPHVPRAGRDRGARGGRGGRV
ncbi:MAG: Octanoate-[acyl-carrier-protein]-protein-N-octanoyltransferase, partial [uncultured Solirubrobacteraceae bacterium]